MADYSQMSASDFDSILLDIMRGMTAQELLRIPGIYEVMSEVLHNDVCDMWALEAQQSVYYELLEPWESDDTDISLYWK
jgi:hypothetical protein